MTMVMKSFDESLAVFYLPQPTPMTNQLPQEIEQAILYALWDITCFMCLKDRYSDKELNEKMKQAMRDRLGHYLSLPQQEEYDLTKDIGNKTYEEVSKKVSQWLWVDDIIKQEEPKQIEKKYNHPTHSSDCQCEGCEAYSDHLR